MKTTVYAALAAVTLGSLAACSTAAAPSRASAPSAHASASRTPAVAAAPSPSRPGSCTAVLAALKSAEASAKSEATAKHAQFPGISVADLQGAAMANELDGADGRQAAAAAEASGNARLASAGKALASDAKTMHDFYGETSGDQATARVQLDLAAIAGVCGNG